MAAYSVSLPITGYLIVKVSGVSSEEEAIDKALNEADYTLDNVESWEAHRQAVQGNVFYGDLNSAEAELIDDKDEDEE